MTLARRLRAAEPAVLELLADTLAEGATVAEAAQLFGLAGASSLWRIAYCVPAVRVIMDRHGRRRGRPRKGTA